MLRAILLAATAVLPSVAFAQGYGVMRIESGESGLYEILTRPKVATTISTQGEERIEAVIAGDSNAFAIETAGNRRAVSILPEYNAGTSSLTVVTSAGSYHFVVRPANSELYESAIYGVVIYENDGEEEGFAYADVNFAYTYRGNEDLRPLRVFDDGKHTYFQFPDHIKTPAIFDVNEKREETLINYHVENDYVIVQKIGRQFTLRDGDKVLCIYNKAYPVPVFDPGSPVEETS